MRRYGVHPPPPIRWDVPEPPVTASAPDSEFHTLTLTAREQRDRADCYYRVNRVWSGVLAILTAWLLCETGGALAGLALVLIAVLWWAARDAKRSSE